MTTEAALNKLGQAIDEEFDQYEDELRRDYEGIGVILALINLRLQRSREKCFWGVEPCGLNHDD